MLESPHASRPERSLRSLPHEGVEPNNASLGQGGAMPHPVEDGVFRGAERASGPVRFPDVMQSIFSEKGST